MILPEAYYTRIWDSTKGGMLADMMATMGAYAEFKGVKVDQATLKADAEAMLEMEYEIATKLNTPQSVRRDFNTMYNSEWNGLKGGMGQTGKLFFSHFIFKILFNKYFLFFIYSGFFTVF